MSSSDQLKAEVRTRSPSPAAGSPRPDRNGMECSNTGSRAVPGWPCPADPTTSLPPHTSSTHDLRAMPPSRPAISRLLSRSSRKRSTWTPRTTCCTCHVSRVSLVISSLMSLLFLTFIFTFTLTLQLLERVRVAPVSGRARSGARACHPVYREEPGVRQGIYASGRGAAGPWAIRRGRGSVQQGARA